MSRPSDHGLPDKFSAWRRGQERALKSVLYGENRFDVLNIPVGGGKSATYMGVALTNVSDDERWAVVTPNNNLLDQLMGDFDAVGLVDFRGRRNYDCLIDETKKASTARCARGFFCEYIRKPGCDYYDRKYEAGHSNLVATNYAKWMATEESDALGTFSGLIFDEAHLAPDEIGGFAQVEIERNELGRFHIPVPSTYGRGIDARIREWAPRAIDLLDAAIDDPGARTIGGSGPGSPSYRFAARDLARRLRRLCRLSDQDWLFARLGPNRWRWDLIEPGLLAEDLLFRGARKIILSSATVNRKTLRTLGVVDNVNVIEQDSTFPVQRRPIYWWPIGRIDGKMSAWTKRKWHEAIDEIIRARVDRRGLIHAVSYDRVWEIFRGSNLTAADGVKWVLHKKGESAVDVLARFDKAGVGAVLVSPAMEQGVDFPYRRAEYQIIPKCPFPVTTDPLVKARKARDKDYVPYTTAIRTVQMSGRVMRASDDQGETFILDDHLGWLKAAYHDYFPRYFTSAIRTVAARDSAPTPPPPLRIAA